MAGALALLIGVAGVVACGGDADLAVKVTTGADALAAAARATGSTSYVIDIDGRTELPSGDVQRISNHGVRSGDRSLMTMEVPTPGTKITMNYLVDGARQFLRYEGMPATSPFPDGWIELTGLPDTSAAVSSTASADSFLQTFRAKDAEVTDRGTTTRDGATVHRYRTTLDLSSQFQLDTHNRMMKRIMANSATSMSKVEADIEVDEQGRITRIAYAVDVAAGSTHVTMTLSDFGEPVTVDVPAEFTSMTIDEFADLAYPEVEPSSVEVDDADLIDRDDFVDVLTVDGALTEEMAGCIYDELRETRPEILVEDTFDQAPSAEARQAITGVAMACGMSGG